MLLLRQAWAIVILTASAVIFSGCPSKPETPPAKPAKEKKPATKIQKDVDAHEPDAKPTARNETPRKEKEKAKPETPAVPATISKVALSGELRATCLVDVGDAMPLDKLPDLSGKSTDLKNLFGEKLTVVCFWTNGATRRSQLVAEAVLDDLTKDIVEPFGTKGVAVVAINIDDPADAAQKAVAKAKAASPCLLDATGALFAKVAKDKRTPRTFLLDADGKILWFDVEYSRQSRQDLGQSIRAALGKL